MRVIGYGLLAWLLFAGIVAAQQPDPNAVAVQEAIQKTIGGLVVQNAQCSQQTLSMASQIETLKKQLAEAQAKTK